MGEWETLIIGAPACGSRRPKHGLQHGNLEDLRGNPPKTCQVGRDRCRIIIEMSSEELPSSIRILPKRGCTIRTAGTLLKQKVPMPVSPRIDGCSASSVLEQQETLTVAVGRLHLVRYQMPAFPEIDTKALNWVG